MNETLFTSLAQARVARGCWRADYNDARPHSQDGKRPPSSPSAVTRAGIWRCARPKAPPPAPLAATTQPGKSNSRSELRIG
ncbi:integrase core domain-containing protein [Bradyrhizobium yuanmingense]|uniref:integrase core domain-containing protein n=1 Tax=Bradyrhizobium yuanmingense TaxID=108015 RepID=UPI003B967F26